MRRSATRQTQVRQDTTNADSSFRAFLSEWEKAQTRFINGDPTAWKQHASHRDDVTILGAFGGYGEKGWEIVGARYDWASSQYKAGEATLKVDIRLASRSVKTWLSPQGLSARKGRAWVTKTRRGEHCEPRKSFGKRTAPGSYCTATPTRLLKSRRHQQPQRNEAVIAYTLLRATTCTPRSPSSMRIKRVIAFASIAHVAATIAQRSAGRPFA